VDEPLKSVPHGQYDARPIRLAAEHHRPLAGRPTKLYYCTCKVFARLAAIVFPVWVPRLALASHAAL